MKTFESPTRTRKSLSKTKMPKYSMEVTLTLMTSTWRQKEQTLEEETNRKATSLLTHGPTLTWNKSTNYPHEINIRSLDNVTSNNS